MKLWQDIISTALVGSERHPLKIDGVDDPSSLGFVIAQHASGNIERAILTSASIATVYQRSGQKLAGLDTPPDIEASKPETRIECPQSASYLISRTINDKYVDILMDVFEILAEHKLRIPYPLIPDILDLAKRHVAFRDVLPDVIGERGRWLISQNPDWSYVSTSTELSEWEFGSKATRVSILKSLASVDPNEARRLIQETWTKESADDRTAFLETREINLSMDDEPFLESALDDRSKEVRKVAQNLLTRIPQSRYVQRMVQRLSDIIQIKYQFPLGHKIEVTPPTQFDDSMVRDGLINEKTEKEGQKGNYIHQVVASIPTGYWQSAYNISAEKLFNLIEKDDWYLSILSGLIESASRYPDAEWTQLIVSIALNSNNRVSIMNTIAPAIKLLPGSTLESIILKKLSDTPLAAAQGTLDLISYHTSQWTPEFTRLILSKLQKTLVEFADDSSFSSIVNLLDIISRRMPVELGSEFSALLDSLKTRLTDTPNKSNYYHNMWLRSIEESITIIKLRHDIINAILSA